MKSNKIHATLMAIAGGLIFTSCSVTKEAQTKTSQSSQRLEPVEKLLTFKNSWRTQEDVHNGSNEVLASKSWTPSAIKNHSEEIAVQKAEVRSRHNRKTIEKVAAVSPPGDCDEIIIFGGERIKAKVLEVGEHEIKYKKCENLDGPTYTMSKSDISEIHYGNGNQEMITEGSKGESSSIAPLLKTDYVALWVWSLLGSGAASIVGVLIIAAGAASMSAGILGVTLVLGGLFLFTGALLSIAFMVYFVCWLLKLVS